jgi:hypothetical protein
MLVYGLPSAFVNGTFRAWLQTFLHSDDVVFDTKDPLPYLLQFRGLLFYLKLADEKGISPLQASTFDIEWNGEWKSTCHFKTGGHIMAA